MATDTVVNTGGRGPDGENGGTGQFVRAKCRTHHPSIKMVVQIVAAEGTANTTVVLCRRRPDCTWSRTGYHAEWGYPVCAQRRYGVCTVVNSDGWQQIIKEGGLADFTTVNQKGKLQVNAGGTATHITLKQGGALVTSTAATVLAATVWAISRWKTVRLTALFWSPAVAWMLPGRPFSAENTGG